MIRDSLMTFPEVEKPSENEWKIRYPEIKLKDPRETTELNP